MSMSNCFECAFLKKVKVGWECTESYNFKWNDSEIEIMQKQHCSGFKQKEPEKKLYHFFDPDTKEHKFSDYSTDSVTEYNLLKNEATEVPVYKLELEDGWYLVRLYASSNEIIREKRGDTTYDLNGNEAFSWNRYTVLKKITMEDIDE